MVRDGQKLTKKVILQFSSAVQFHPVRISFGYFPNIYQQKLKKKRIIFGIFGARYLTRSTSVILSTAQFSDYTHIVK